MNEPVIATLSPSEMQLVRLFREPAKSALGGRIKGIVEALLEVAREPHCPEKPCPNEPEGCDHCVQVKRVLEGLEAIELQMRGLPGA